MNIIIGVTLLVISAIWLACEAFRKRKASKRLDKVTKLLYNEFKEEHGEKAATKIVETMVRRVVNRAENNTTSIFKAI